MKRAHEVGKLAASLPQQEPTEHLPFVVELRTGPPPIKPEVLVRAADFRTAEAVFKAAACDPRGHQVVLKRGDEVLLRSGH
jgi:hypothetical protein